MKSTNFNLKSKTLVDHPRKRQGGKIAAFLWFATKSKFGAAYDLNVEAIFFAIG